VVYSYVTLRHSHSTDYGVFTPFLNPDRRDFDREYFDTDANLDRVPRAISRPLVLPKSRLPDRLKAPSDFAQDLTFDTGRIRSELGLEEKVSAGEAMRPTIAWEREHDPNEST